MNLPDCVVDFLVVHTRKAHASHNWWDGLCLQRGNELDACWMLEIRQLIIQFTLLQTVQVFLATFLLHRSIISHWANKKKWLCGTSPNTAGLTTLFQVATADADELALLLRKSHPNAQLQEMLNTASDKNGENKRTICSAQIFNVVCSLIWSSGHIPLPYPQTPTWDEEKHGLGQIILVVILLMTCYPSWADLSTFQTSVVQKDWLGLPSTSQAFIKQTNAKKNIQIHNIILLNISHIHISLIKNKDLDTRTLLLVPSAFWSTTTHVFSASNWSNIICLAGT